MGLKRTLRNITGVKNELEVNLDDIISKNIEIDDTDIDGEKVMMNLDKGQYFMMNEVGSRIWEIIETPIHVKGIVEKLREEYDVDEQICTDKVLEFLKSLNEADLIKVS